MEAIESGGDHSLEGRAALVTGGTSGIGLAIARRLLGRGATVGVTALPEHATAAADLVRQMDPSGRRLRAYGLDVRSSASVAQVVDEFSTEVGGFDLLVNNAGVRLVVPSLDMAEDAWDDLVSVNLRGVFLCSQAAARQMLEGGGAIVNISSQLGIVAARDRAAYCASKAAVIHLTRALALDWAPHGIRVNAVAPGPTHTEATGVAPDAESALDFLSRMPLGRPIEPDDVASAVVYLAAPESRAITGHTIVVDGGWTLA